ncbi:PPC domain-containing protein [Lignipirellula cremea]|uniref:Peptidase C-terminal archaeal/bacterial domain-containing protein n=1 Tax=Lignipirellula cremea TaxID=2528010 RepID=A0A518DPD3_9BACT|nr:PPC domain-containing protein [Lignipirellula cremea]QDU93689.1 hypothetical protein Pla8534_14700 [Lignipirellula cremea]
MLQRPALTIVCAALCGAFPLAALAQFPAARLGAVSPTGIQAGQAVELVLAGSDLDDVQTLRFSHPGITARQKLAEPNGFDKTPLPLDGVFEVQAAANVPPGAYEVRAEGKYGVSNPRWFFVGAIAEHQETEPNNQADAANTIALPAAVSGSSQAAADVDYYAVEAAAGQRIVINCLSRRIDSRMDLVVVVLDPQGRVLANSRDEVQGDPLIDFTAPRADRYLVKVYDTVYEGGPDYFYRLVIGSQPHIDYVFPPASLPGNGQFTIYGRNLPGGQNAGVSLDGAALQKLNVTVPIPAAPQLNVDSGIDAAAGSVDGTTWRLASPQGLSNAVLLSTARAKVVLETEPNNNDQQSQKLTLPCEAAGQFYPQRDRDWYEFEAKEGEQFSLEVISQRLGVKSNPALLLMQVVPPGEDEKEPTLKILQQSENSGDSEGGNEVATLNEDPQLQFTAPADGTYRVLVYDLRASLRDDPRLVYRLLVRQAQPDFRLTAAAEFSYAAVNLRPGDQTAVRVAAFRSDGFDGEIRVTAAGLPPGVTASEAVIGPGKTAAAIILKAAPNAAPGTSSLKVTGTAKVGAANVVREARLATPKWSQPYVANNQPQMQLESRLTPTLAVSVLKDTPAPMTAFEAGAAAPYETSRGGILKIPYTRSGPFTGKILQAEVVDLPPNVTSVRADITAAKGEIELKVLAAAVPGTYTLYLDGLAEKVDHSRNPEAAAAAALRQKEVDGFHTAALAEAKAAADAKTVADKGVVDGKTAVTQATTAQVAAAAKKTAADTALATATAAVAPAKAAVTAKPEDAAAKTALAAAEKAVVDAATAAKAAADGLTAADKALLDAQTALTAAEKVQAEADALAIAMKEKADAATLLKAETDKQKTALDAAAKPTPVNVPVVSSSFVLTITESPITLTPLAAATVTQGEKIEIPVTFARKYGYTAAVTVTQVTSPAVPGLSIPNLSIGPNQTQGKLALSTTTATPEGPHTLLLRLAMSFNGQNVQIEEPLTITIKKAPPKP